MHFYFITRGQKCWVDEFITQLQGKYFPFKYKGQDSAIQMGVRPIQLWEVAFPKEYKDMVLNTILSSSDGKRPEYAYMDKYLFFLRKILKADKVGEYSKTQFFPILKEHIDIIGIGTRDDQERDFGEGI